MKILSTLDSSHKWLSYEIKRHNQEYTPALEALEHEVNAINQKFSKLINQNVTQAINEYQLHKFQLQKKELQQAKQTKIFLILSILFCIVFFVLSAYIVRQKIRFRDAEIDKNLLIASQLRKMLKASQDENQELQNALDGLFNQHFATIDQLSATYYEMHAAYIYHSS